MCEIAVNTTDEEAKALFDAIADLVHGCRFGGMDIHLSGAKRRPDWLRDVPEQEREEPTVVENLRVGDIFEWCSRWVQIVRIEEQVRKYLSPHSKHGRWLHVEDGNGTPHRLHYWDEEVVTRWVSPRTVARGGESADG